MMPFLESVREVWSRLGYLQREQNERPPRRPDGLARNVGFRMPALGHYDSGARMRRVRSALFASQDKACWMLAERLSGINLSMVLGALISACEEVAVVWGGSVLLGGTIGGGIGISVGGIGVAPGAVLGAGMGAQAGLWILGFLGLKSLIEDLGTAVPEVLRLYEEGFRTAWGRLDDGGTFIPSDGDDFRRLSKATYSFAQGPMLLMVTMLTALLAYLSRGRGDPAAKARILQEISESKRLGPKMADWVAATEEALARHPGLKPREQQVTMAAAPAKDVGPPISPAELRRLRDEGPPSAPKAADAPKKPEPATPPKVMPQKKVRCFEPNGLPQAKTPEFDRQLAGQERGINDEPRAAGSGARKPRRARRGANRR
jgi:hypothetical protein